VSIFSGEAHYGFYLKGSLFQCMPSQKLIHLFFPERQSEENPVARFGLLGEVHVIGFSTGTDKGLMKSTGSGFFVKQIACGV
jgi:hypothetical protein